MAGFTRIVAALILLGTPVLGADNPFLPAQDPVPLLAAIEKETPDFTPPAGVTGISVPHHLLAADLIARGFWAASAGQYRRIIVISPDHFHRVTKPFGTTRETLRTVFGAVAPDAAAIEVLVSDAMVETLPTIETEHGVMALLPFVRHFFPDAEVIPLLASVNAGPDDWRAMADALKPLVTADTLIVQSTDYSHYRPYAEAIARDQETLSMIAAADPEGVVPLLQPAHMDSKAAQFIQMVLQRDVFGARPVVLANANSVEYGTGTGSTTSYITTAWLRDAADGAVLDYGDQTRTMFGGDVLLGRYFLPALRDPAAWGVLRDTVLDATRGTKLIVNLEGVLLDGAVTGVDFNTHVMVSADAAPVIAALNIGAASLANNHANDLGPEGRAESKRLLERLGVTAMEHGALTDFGAFRLLALNFVGGKFIGDAIAAPDDLDWVCGLHAAPPLVAFVHWGKEYVGPSDKERRIAETLARCGVSLIVGAHSHQASEAIKPLRGGAAQLAYSLGNFIFDQSAPGGSGAVLEMRVFKQGTVAARLVPIPNLFDLTKGRDF